MDAEISKRYAYHGFYQRAADWVSRKNEMEGDLGCVHVRFVKPGSDCCRKTSHLLADAICGPWEILKLDGNDMMRQNDSSFLLEGKEKEKRRQYGIKMFDDELSILKEEPAAGGNPERLLSSIFLGSKSEEILADLRKSYFDDLELFSRECLPWHKVYQDYMYIPVEFFRNIAEVSTWLDDKGLRHLLEEMWFQFGEVIEAETIQQFWYLLIMNAMQFRRTVLERKINCEGTYWFWSSLLNMQLGILGDYYEKMMPTLRLSGVHGLKEIALLHLELRTFVDFQHKGAKATRLLTLNTEMWNAVVRTEYVPLKNCKLVILCHPARPITDDSQMLPIPKYAAVTVDVAARGFQGNLSFQNEYVDRKGLPVDSDCNPKKEGWELLNVSVDAVRRVLLESTDTLAFIATSGKQVHERLVAEYCRYLNESGIDNEKLDEIIDETVTNPVKDEVLEAIMRLRTIFNEVRGEKPSGIAPDRSINDTPKEHAAMDDIAKKLQNSRELFGGAIKISRPTGTEWHEKVADTWKGEIEGKTVTVKLNMDTGKMYCNEGKTWRRIMSTDMTGTAEIKMPFGKLGISGTPLFGMPEIDPFRYLVSGSDRKLARMALFAVEKQKIVCSKQSSSYLLRDSSGGEKHARVHIASITADILNGMDMYYDNRKKRLIVKFFSRFMEVSELRSRFFKLTEIQNVKREKLYLANGEIMKRGCKLG